MLIYIIRHGQAQGSSATGRDRDRKLTEKGHQQSRAIGVYLAGCRPMPRRVITSPLVRAQETAIAACEPMALAMQTDDRLGSDQGLSEMLAVLEDHREEDAIAIVGHMPTLGQLCTSLTEGATGSTSSLRTGEVAVIRVDGDELVGGGVLIEVFRMAE